MNRVLARTGARDPIVQAPLGWASTAHWPRRCRVRAAFAAQQVYLDGDMEAAPALARQSAGLIHDALTVEQIIDAPVAELHAITARLGRRRWGGRLGDGRSTGAVAGCCESRVGYLVALCDTPRGDQVVSAQRPRSLLRTRQHGRHPTGPCPEMGRQAAPPEPGNPGPGCEPS